MAPSSSLNFDVLQRHVDGGLVFWISYWNFLTKDLRERIGLWQSDSAHNTATPTS